MNDGLSLMTMDSTTMPHPPVRRVDFMLQEHGMESFVKTVGVLQSHTNYFATTDVSYFILMKLHNLKIILR